MTNMSTINFRRNVVLIRCWFGAVNVSCFLCVLLSCSVLAGKLDDHTIFALVMFLLSLFYITASMIFGQLSYLTPFRQASVVLCRTVFCVVPHLVCHFLRFVYAYKGFVKLFFYQMPNGLISYGFKPPPFPSNS